MSTPSFGYSEPQNRSRSVSHSSTDSVLSMSSFGVSLSSAAQAKSPEAEASSSETVSGPPAVASPHGIYTQSSRFFMTDKVVRFLAAGDVLFQVHSSVLEHHSGWFSAQLALPEDALPPGWHEARDVPGAPPGLAIFVHSESGMVSCSRPTSKDPVSDAIVLDDISVDGFEAFLSVLYPKDLTTFDLDATSDRDWTAVLKIAHRWDCPMIKALAVERLDIILSESQNDTYFKRLALARAYNVISWLMQAISGLCARRDTLVEEEIAQMRPADVQHVLELREEDLQRTVARVTREAQALSAKAPEEGTIDKTSSSLEINDEPVKASGTVDVAERESTATSASQGDGSVSATACPERPGGFTMAASSQEKPSSQQSEFVQEADALSCAEFEDLDREVRRLLDALTTENVELTVGELGKWAVKSIDEEDTRTLGRIAQLIVGKAGNLEAKDADLHARMCRTLSLRLHTTQLNHCGTLEAGGTVFHKLLISKFKRSFDLAHGRCRCHTNGSVAGARCRLALTRFFGEFFDKNIMNEGSIRAFVERLLANVTDPQMEHAETACELLMIVGKKLDTGERRTTMDGYIDRIWAMHLKLRENRDTDFTAVLQNLIDLRNRQWLPVHA